MSNYRAVIQTFSDIQPEPIRWLWPGRFPLGKLVLIAGDAGLGKSQITVDIAARISNGRRFPDGETPPGAGDTLILTVEDDPADTIRPRLDACMADVDRVHFLRCRVNSKGRESAPSIRDVDVIADAFGQIEQKGGRPMLLVIDPIMAFLAGADAHKDAEVREVLTPLATLCAEQGVTPVLVGHLNKSSNSPQYRIGGTVAFPALARAAFLVVADQADRSQRYFLPLKNNLGPDQGGFGYTIAVDPLNGAPFIQWGDPAQIDLRDLLAKEQPRRDKVAPLQDSIVSYLHDVEHASTGTIAEALEKSVQSISNALRKLRDAGSVEQGDRYGEWRLTSRTPPREGGVSGESGETQTTYTSECRREGNGDSPLTSLSTPTPVGEGDETGRVSR